MSSWSFLTNTLTLLGQKRVYYQWLRVEQLDQWWHWLLLLMVCLSVLCFIVYWYRRDSVEQPKPVGWALVMLRIAAMLGLLFHFMQFEKRSEQKIVRQSRLAVLVDTSLSMTLAGTPSEVGVASTASRIQEVAKFMQDSDLVNQLAARHQLTIYRFDSQSRPSTVAAVPRQQTQETNQTESSQEEPTLQAGRWLALLALALGVAAAAAIGISLGAQFLGYRTWEPGGWVLLSGATLMLASLTAIAFAIIPNTAYTLGSLFSQVALRVQDATIEPSNEPESIKELALPEDWHAELQANGTETRLGDAIRAILDRELGNPLAGILVFTDGCSNAGIDPKQIAVSAKNARVPLFFVGLGSEKSPPNAQIVELDVPKRLYPGDKFSLKALIGGVGFEGKQLAVQVASGPKDGDARSFRLDGEQQVELPADGTLAQAEFKLEPRTVGQWQYQVRILPPAGDAEPRDDSMSATVEVIERKNRVLILAGGPTREYQFVRNLLFRDRDVESHVLLQTATAASSQESQELLTEFPATRAELSNYDAVLAFDADWLAIPDASVAALEQWVAEQAGGFLIVAGSVEMPKWISRSSPGARSQHLRALSPVVLEQRGSRLLAGGRVESPTPWRLVLTADGMQTDFMWVSDDPDSSLEIWNSFAGVYGYYSAYELKPGAKALAFFGDPNTLLDGQLPIYIASQFYGGGRVAYLGGGEMWRMRSEGEQYFDRFYTKLVRWISQGRLMLDSDRGILLVDREQATLREQVIVRAVLKTEQYEPLIQAEVVARLIDSQGNNVPLVLRPLADGSQPGVYSGQFPVLVPGEYRIELLLSGSPQEVLSVEVRGRVPASEMQSAERNDLLLAQLASDTGGLYWKGTAASAAQSPNGLYAVADAIVSQDSIAFLPGAQDRDFQIRWLGWLMTWIACCLSLEWLARRVHRLA
ncbi:MAG: hypothetical protein KDB22_01885 [Planctomycetales bacterium]|nr:hypothetical protein [Planctomycetales bacterium]